MSNKSANTAVDLPALDPALLDAQTTVVALTADHRRQGSNRLLERQLREAAGPDGRVVLERLIEIISRHYDSTDEERRSVVRSMQMMSDEAQALTREIHEQNATQMQAIVDHVKDVIRREPGKKVKERGLDRILAELESLSDNEVQRFVDH